jgi:hypothetical protein
VGVLKLRNFKKSILFNPLNISEKYTKCLADKSLSVIVILYKLTFSHRHSNVPSPRHKHPGNIHALSFEKLDAYLCIHFGLTQL